MRLRRELDWTQSVLAAKLRVSKRTVSNWECGYWLPPFKQRLHVLFSLRDAPAEYVIEIADGLGVSADPSVGTFLQPYRDALDGAPPADVAPSPEPEPEPPPRVPVDPVRLREAIDALVRDAADAMNVPANELREAVGRVAEACAGLGGTLEEMRDAVAVKKRGKRAGA